MIFLVHKQGRESEGETGSLLIRHWNTVHSPRVHILKGLENWRRWKNYLSEVTSEAGEKYLETNSSAYHKKLG